VETNRDKAFVALADPTRRTIFERLAQTASPVGRLASTLPISRPAVSQHLKVLKEAGLVTDRAEGTRRIYAVDPAGVVELRDYFDGFWRQALAAFADSATRSHTRIPDRPGPDIPEEL
jgi:DNA-binding transcriptional ArsR family regulator